MPMKASRSANITARRGSCPQRWRRRRRRALGARRGDEDEGKEADLTPHVALPERVVSSHTPQGPHRIALALRTAARPRLGPAPCRARRGGGLVVGAARQAQASADPAPPPGGHDLGAGGWGV